MFRPFLICLLFLPASVIADQSDERLDDLFSTLLISTDLTTIRSTENQIWEIWFNHANEDVEQLIQMGVTRMNYNRYAEAMLIFTQLIENFPDYAEGWNRRATLHYILGNLDESVADIEKMEKNNEEYTFRTLKLTLRNKYFISLRIAFVDQSP